MPPNLTLSRGAYSMHTRRSGERARRSFCFSPMVVSYILSGERGWRYRFRSTLGDDAFGLHASGSEGQTAEFRFFFAFAQYLFKGLGGERGNVYWRLSTLSGGALGMHATGSGGRVRTTFCVTPSTIPFFWCGGRGLGVLVAFYPRWSCFWYACQRIRKRARGGFAFRRLHC